METKVFYFTGSGNCLSIARKLSAVLDNASIASIAQLKGPDVRGEVLGIVSPIYMHDMPHIVIDFIQRIKRADYLFFVYAGGGEPGRGLTKVKRLCKKQGLPLRALYNIPMPSNYTPFGYPDEEKQRSLFEAANERIEAIAETVSKRGTHFDKDPTGIFRSFVYPGALYRLGHPQIRRMDNGFSCDESCNSCEICKRICPVGNISVHDGKPQWHHHCEQCFACLNWCPRNAIQYRESTRGVGRYHHPDAKMGDIVGSSGK